MTCCSGETHLLCTALALCGLGLPRPAARTWRPGWPRPSGRGTPPRPVFQPSPFPAPGSGTRVAFLQRNKIAHSRGTLSCCPKATDRLLPSSPSPPPLLGRGRPYSSPGPDEAPGPGPALPGPSRGARCRTGAVVEQQRTGAVVEQQRAEAVDQLGDPVPLQVLAALPLARRHPALPGDRARPAPRAGR